MRTKYVDNVIIVDKKLAFNNILHVELSISFDGSHLIVSAVYCPQNDPLDCNIMHLHFV